MKTSKSLLIVSLFSTLVFAFCSCSSNDQLPVLDLSEDLSHDKIEAIDNWLGELQSQQKFNGGVLIAQDGQALLQKTYGYVDATLTTKLTKSSMFRLASLSKQFTAMGIMILKEKGKLDFDDKVIKYIPELPYKDITIRNLLNHISGIPDNYIGLYDQAEIEILTNEKAVDLVIKRDQKASKLPKEEYSYSNTGYILAARTIELISGQSMEDFLKMELFEPIGMTESRVWNLISDDKTFPNKTSSFKYRGKKTVALNPTGIDGVAGDGAIFSSIGDFLIWDQFLYQNDLISEATMKEAFVSPQLLSGAVSNYGFGWVLNRNIISHTGSWLGARTVIRRDIKNKTCIVILDNSQSNYIDKILDQVIDIL